ncbi:unnamed protein product [Rotaria socialis]|uniref:Alpha-(1,6)-fucosyltransferase N- and catalytic domain-containing protein n=1 Tax=Rotaria socialis TaxID=392032 RepID=A0A821B8I8_9BILA|nr:unnamed protein product [Rotaria socialis]CAF3307679.1 unnamed protein product [Rotaria socialis]CAF3324205.1 unnamed protein product [Rotaria socialis]CAF3690690.1 unnamed protein product [Rotaria socialis]CAF4449568.1 unnamed protein product [Rotaria socialis]
MIFSKIIKLLKIVLFILIFIFLWIKYDQYSTQLQLLLLLNENTTCSFDNIVACQSSKIRHRTFLYIIWGGAGFGSEINQLLLAFAYSISTKRHFLIDSQQWNYGNFNHYFNISSTNYYFQSNRQFLVENNTLNNEIDHLKTTRIGTQVRKFWLATRQVQSFEVKRKVAQFLWKSISKETLNFIENCQIKNFTNYIGIHIRKGDKLKSEAPSVSLEQHIKSIENIFNKTKTIQNIFVASDDLTVIKQFRHLKPIWNFFQINYNNYQDINRTGHFQSKFNHLSLERKLFETRLLMCELQMLINSQYVSCSMYSNICRLLKILRYQHPTTTVSLGRSWYPT